MKCISNAITLVVQLYECSPDAYMMPSGRGTLSSRRPPYRGFKRREKNDEDWDAVRIGSYIGTRFQLHRWYETRFVHFALGNYGRKAISGTSDIGVIAWSGVDVSTGAGDIWKAIKKSKVLFGNPSLASM